MYQVPGTVLSIPYALKLCHYLHFTTKETEGYIRCEKVGHRRVLDQREVHYLIPCRKMS